MNAIHFLLGHTSKFLPCPIRAYLPYQRRTLPVTTAPHPRTRRTTGADWMGLADSPHQLYVTRPTAPESGNPKAPANGV